VVADGFSLMKAVPRIGGGAPWVTAAISQNRAATIFARRAGELADGDRDSELNPLVS
jgi:hypothetical protein